MCICRCDSFLFRVSQLPLCAIEGSRERQHIEAILTALGSTTSATMPGNGHGHGHKPSQRLMKDVEVDELLALFRAQPLEASGDAFFKTSALQRHKKFHVELRGSSLIMFRSALLANSNSILMRDIIGVLVLKYYTAEVDKKQGQSPKIHLHGRGISDGQSLYIKALTETQLQVWLQALAIAESLQLPGLSTMTIESIIGRGGGGKVFLVRDNSKRENYALKVIDKRHTFSSPGAMRHVLAERQLMESIGQHPFVLPMKFAFQSDTNLFIGTPFCRGGDLATYLKNQLKKHGSRSPEVPLPNGKPRRYGGHLSEERARPIIGEILLAIEHLHGIGIAYRDLKPENVLIANDGHLRLADFGLARQLQKSSSGNGYHRTGSVCGTRNYLPPEMLLGRLYGVEVDLWSLGILCFRTLCGRFPFEASKTKDMFQQVKRDKVRVPSFISPKAKSLLEGLLCRDQSRRLTVTGAKEHAFFQGLDWDALRAKRLPPPITDVELNCKSAVDALHENFELSKLQGITLGEYLPEDAGGGRGIDCDPEWRMAPEGRIFGFEYVAADSLDGVPPPLEVKRASSGLRDTLRRRPSAVLSDGAGKRVSGFLSSLSPRSSRGPQVSRQMSPTSVLPDRVD